MRFRIIPIDNQNHSKESEKGNEINGLRVRHNVALNQAGETPMFGRTKQPAYGLARGSKVRKPRHIREARVQVLAQAKVNALELKAKGLMPTSKGYALSPSPKVSHKFSEHPGRGCGSRAEKITSLSTAITHSNMPKAHRFISNADASLTGKQLKSKYRTYDAEFYTVDLRDQRTDKRAMRKVRSDGKREKFVEVGMP